MSTASKRPPSRRGVLGVHPVLAAFGAIVLVLFGAVLGAWLNVSQRDGAVIATAPLLVPSADQTPAPSPQPPRYLGLRSTDFRLPADVGPPSPEGMGSVLATKPIVEPQQIEPLVNQPAAAPPRVAYAVSAPIDPAQPIIAIVIDDMGLDRERSQRMIDLPGPLTLSFLTYSSDMQAWADRARLAGHEVMAHVPMQPLSTSEDPGPNALTMAMTQEDITQSLTKQLGGWHGYVGINNHMGSRLTADRDRMAAVMAYLKSGGLLWLDSRTSAETVGESVADNIGVPHIARDIFLDNSMAPADIDAQLALVEKHARDVGSVIAIGHPHDSTRDALSAWLPTLGAKGFSLVSVTEILKRRSDPVPKQISAGRDTTG